MTKYNSLLSKLSALVLLLALIHPEATGQPYLSNLHATADDPVYTTYAAPPERSAYKTDQGWQLMWTNPAQPVGFTSADAGETGLYLVTDGQLHAGTGSYTGKPVITASYSDIVKLCFYPSESLRVEATFCVYSSGVTIQRYVFINESGKPVHLKAMPYTATARHFSDIAFSDSTTTFSHRRDRDDWMKSHRIPLAEDFTNSFATDIKPDGYGIYQGRPENGEMLSGKLNGQAAAGQAGCIIYMNNITLGPGERKTLTVLRSMQEKAGLSAYTAGQLFKVNLEDIISQDEKAYAGIPELNTAILRTMLPGSDLKSLYYSCFSLMRQCMMPAEGKCGYNYYVFSREPKWGWGFGGQVFHESLSMLAYAYMDPVGAMNSQRVFMQRQQDDGYINYRSGPYLDETIETYGMKTSSAPFFCYTNYNIYLVTRDRQFLREAYDSGKKLVSWFRLNRDKDQDGLLEWGGNATLESVRDGRVDVWDNVSKPENLEGPDLNSMFIQELICMGLMARELNLENEFRSWINTANKLSGIVNRQLWDEETGFYYNTLLSANGFTFLEKNDLKIKEIIGFLPMWADYCSKEQAKRLVASLSNPEEFWRPYGIPTLSAKSQYYNPMGYWNGPAWIQWEYLVFRGLIDYGYFPLANQLAGKVLDQTLWHLKNDHTFWELYSPDKRQAGWNRTYIWAGLAARFLIDLQMINTPVNAPATGGGNQEPVKK